MPTQPDESQGRKLLTAVERLLADTGVLEERVHAAEAEVPRGEMDETEWRHQVARRLIDVYSNKSALSGGAAALPSIVPILGSLVSLVGGTLADVALMLKFEVELSMCLSILYGYDVREEQERQIAFLLASVGTYDAKADRSLVVDLAAAEGTAIWNYTPRELSKGIVSTLTKIALLSLSESFVRILPVVGVAVGAGMNKVLTRRVGRRCEAELVRRRRIVDEASAGKARRAKTNGVASRRKKRSGD